MELVFIFLAFILGIAVGTLTILFIKGRRMVSGTIRVRKSEGKIVYSLELDHAPEILESKDEAVFKIETPE